MPAAPLISVILPVYDGRSTIDRALRSVAEQVFANWEAVIVDDGSTDGSCDLIHDWAERDNRIVAVRMTENQGSSAARNTAIRLARGPIIAYLDHDDEYYPDYLEQLSRFDAAAGLLVFGYDMVFDGHAASHKTSWDPARVGHALFEALPATLLGISHRRELWEKLGGYNELLWRNEDWDFWRRAARAGYKTEFLPLRSGKYHVRKESLSRVPHLTHCQRGAATANWKAGQPIFAEPTLSGTRKKRSPKGAVGKVAFLSPHCVIDFTNGAATATLDGLSLLAGQGYACQAFCSTRLDAWSEVQVKEVLAREGIPHQEWQMLIGQLPGRMTFANRQGVDITLFNTASTQNGLPTAEERESFLAGCETFLLKNRPDVIWTYGGDPVSLAMQAIVKRHDIPIVFALHNFNYSSLAPFERADYVIVPTEFARQFYWNTIGLACQKLPVVIDQRRVVCHDRDPHFVTFVNPEPRKGVVFFARIALELANRRPDIQLLLVEGAAKYSDLSKLGIDLSSLTNLTVLPNTPDAKEFYRGTRILLMPSLVENAGLVASEAMLNGIPVIASSRGGLPETIGDAGILLNVHARHRPETRELPTAEEAQPWIEAIERLWDNASEYNRRSLASRERAKASSPEQLAPVYRDFFSSVTHQPGPPIVPKEP